MGELQVAQCSHATIKKRIREECEAVSRLRMASVKSSLELRHKRMALSLHNVTPETILENEEAIRAEARALTFEVSELEAGLDAAITMHSTGTPRRHASGGPHSRGAIKPEVR